MRNEILKLLLNRKNLTLLEQCDLLLYWVQINELSKEFRYAWHIDNVINN